jgi:hypothetical protein
VVLGVSEAKSTGGNETVAARALRAAVRSVGFEPGAVVITAPDDRVWVTFSRPGKGLLLTPAGARVLADALLRGAAVAEANR